MMGSPHRITRVALVVAAFIATSASPLFGREQFTAPGAKQSETASVSARIVPNSAQPGDKVRVEIALTIPPGFYTYDLDQPESKASAPEIKLDVSKALEPLGDWSGPPPDEKTDEFGTRLFVHHTGPTWMREFKLAADAREGDHKISGSVRFQYCNANGCRMKAGEIQLTLAVKPGGVKGSEAAAPRAAHLPGGGNGSSTESTGDGLKDPTPAGPTAAANVSSGSTSSEIVTLVSGLLGEVHVVHVDDQVTNLWGALVFGFLAGMILNVMPCVLPVISLKIYGFVRQAHEERARVRLLGLAFGAGILAVFLILAAAAAFFGLKWGQQFQSDTFQIGMIALMVAFTLGMFDVYMIRLPGFVGDADMLAAQKEGLAASFAKGMLATLLATPCSGPFLGATLSYTLTQPPLVIFAVFTSIGLGMACPYVVLAWEPRWMRILPKPGEWMTGFKEFMGFLMLATAVWLLWQRRLNGELVVWTIAFCLFVALAMWVYGRWSDPNASRAKRWAAPGVAAALMAGGGYFCFEVMYEKPHQVAHASKVWPAFDLDKALEARAAGKTLVIDWTADW